MRIKLRFKVSDIIYVSYNWIASPVWTHGIYVVVDQGNSVEESNEADKPWRTVICMF